LTLSLQLWRTGGGGMGHNSFGAGMAIKQEESHHQGRMDVDTKSNGGVSPDIRFGMGSAGHEDDIEDGDETQVD